MPLGNTRTFALLLSLSTSGSLLRPEAELMLGALRSMGNSGRSGREWPAPNLYFRWEAMAWANSPAGWLQASFCYPLFCSSYSQPAISPSPPLPLLCGGRPLGFEAPTFPGWQIFWVAKNGIRYTGMGGYSPEMSDDNAWKGALFLSRLKSLPPKVAVKWHQKNL